MNSTVSIVSPTKVAQGFTDVYYKVMAKIPHRLSEFYGESSTLDHGKDVHASGLYEISELCAKLPMHKKAATLHSVTGQVIPDANGSVVVVVHGSYIDGKFKVPFTQSFVLVKQAGSHKGHFYCSNDVFTPLFASSISADATESSPCVTADSPPPTENTSASLPSPTSVLAPSAPSVESIISMPAATTSDVSEIEPTDVEAKSSNAEAVTNFKKEHTSVSNVEAPTRKPDAMAKKGSVIVPQVKEVLPSKPVQHSIEQVAVLSNPIVAEPPVHAALVKKNDDEQQNINTTLSAAGAISTPAPVASAISTSAPSAPPAISTPTPSAPLVKPTAGEQAGGTANKIVPKPRSTGPQASTVRLAKGEQGDKGLSKDGSKRALGSDGHPKRTNVSPAKVDVDSKSPAHVQQRKPRVVSVSHQKEGHRPTTPLQPRRKRNVRPAVSRWTAGVKPEGECTATPTPTTPVVAAATATAAVSARVPSATVYASTGRVVPVVEAETTNGKENRAAVLNDGVRRYAGGNNLTEVTSKARGYHTHRHGSMQQQSVTTSENGGGVGGVDDARPPKYGPSAVVKLSSIDGMATTNVQHVAELLRMEFGRYGHELRAVNVKASKGIAFIEYASVEGVRTAVGMWAKGPRKDGPFAGIALHVSEKRFNNYTQRRTGPNRWLPRYRGFVNRGGHGEGNAGGGGIVDRKKLPSRSGTGRGASAAVHDERHPPPR